MASANKLLREYISLMVEGHEPFDLSHFRQLGTYQEMMQYLKLSASRIGMGAARDAWDTGQGYVIKLGPDATARVQNKYEVRVFNKTKSPLVPKILSQAPDLKWIAAEKVTPLRSIGEVNDAIAMATEGQVSDLPSLLATLRATPATEESKWLSELRRLVRASGLKIEELHKGNWGVNDAGTLVVLDTGK